MIVVEGQDGAAKTPVCVRLAAALDAAHVRVFHEVNAALGHDVYALWEAEPERAVRLVRERLALPRGPRAVYDRGWLTVVMGLEEFGHDHLVPAVVAGRPWTVFLDQQTAFVRRRSARLQAGEPPWDLDADHARRARWAGHCDLYVDLDGEADLDAVVAQILQAWRGRTVTR